MTARQKLQLAYELAFQPVRLNAAWNDWEKGSICDSPAFREALDWALTLHQRLPEAPAVTGRALRRLAHYQATARIYRLPTMLRRLRAQVGSQTNLPEEVPAWMVRDIAVPLFARPRAKRRGQNRRT